MRLWHKNGVMAPNKPRRAPPPLDPEKLRELALRYVGKYATTRAKLCQYLARKLRERGWQGGAAPDLEKLADRFAELGLIDDAAFALAKARSLGARGYGKRRLTEQLRHAGVQEEDSAQASAHADNEALEAALKLARRRRIGPFSSETPDPSLRQKWIAAMVRAGHGFDISKAISAMSPGENLDLDQLPERFQQFKA
ncbi:MAG: regulatory protein RecX [Sphingomonas sp.]|nr:regulatory protein RecX [Sphingomonas sp.]